ncbi:Carboxylesterase family-domain-containing protein, partial [Mycena epipterygia]
LVFGTASLPGYDGTSLATNQNLVVVTINYRTNIFGFPSSRDLPITQNNLGFLDQELALKWVQLNIAQFGGDPDKVTIMGQSAGAASVGLAIVRDSRQHAVPSRCNVVWSSNFLVADPLLFFIRRVCFNSRLLPNPRSKQTRLLETSSCINHSKLHQRATQRLFWTRRRQ